ncbi:hypothetical protein [Moorena sp. SIO3I6]|nr:hypothetical protein [Moorena sp. SIO3I6]NEP26757.1 hypothetical protein [Moorena sp. SIO3I6]
MPFYNTYKSCFYYLCKTLKKVINSSSPLLPTPYSLFPIPYSLKAPPQSR